MIILLKRIALFWGFIAITFSIGAQINYPDNVKKALTQTTKNRPQLETALQYFHKKGDSLQIKAIHFLIANMPGHYSEDYIWVDSLNRRLPYNETKFYSEVEINDAIKKLSQQYGKIRPMAVRYQDIDTITASMLIESIEYAFQVADVNELKNNHAFAHAFFDYVLPYRVSTEPIQNWRKVYHAKFSSLKPETKNYSGDSSVFQIGKSIKSWFTNTYKVLQRTEPLPRLGPLQLLSRAKGPCEDIADLTAYMARSQGIPATIDIVPAWATASGAHCLNAVINSDGKVVQYDVADEIVNKAFQREPSKVIRITYSRQPGTVYSDMPDTNFIPNGFMRTANYIDVTKDYWEVADLKSSLFPQLKGKTKVGFACVWNYFNWRPVWHGKADQNGTLNFTNMAKGAVYLPVMYVKGKILPVGWPVVHDYNQTIELVPDTLHKRQVIIEEQAKYLAFRQGKEYTLFYWANQWIRVGTQRATTSITNLRFDNVPQNALLLLVPEYTEGKERPFIVTKEGKRFWY